MDHACKFHECLDAHQTIIIVSRTFRCKYLSQLTCWCHRSHQVFIERANREFAVDSV